VFVGGVNFGAFNAAPISVRLGGTQIPSVSVISDALLTFINTPGIGIQKSIRLEIDSLSTEISMAFTYFAPVMSSILLTNVPATASVSISILGSNMHGHIQFVFGQNVCLCNECTPSEVHI
jgi:hypothetical protein